MSALACSD